MRMSTEPGYASPAVTVASSLPRRAAASTVLIVPVVSTGEDDKPGAAVASAEPFLSSDAVAEIESGLRALEATGGAEQVHRLVVPSLPVSSVLTIGLGKPRPEWPADTVAGQLGQRGDHRLGLAERPRGHT
ncbi:M17 family peptidase N-terminal domain-containing protein, partial [Mycobacterium mantenii]|uniref:M17 family peptidase N-terminal domain-containing protein n=2 Tax=Mycobacterium mantenii TaxID=560555 RepID=UPI002415F567